MRELTSDVREAIARAIHERYRAGQEGRKPTDDPALAEWGSLPESLKESNRDQADHIVELLERIGCSVHEALRFSEEEVELLAELEHERWCAQRLRDGWRLGPRDPERKLTPLLAPWSELPRDARESRRETVRAIPEYLAEVGLEVRREPHAELRGSTALVRVLEGHTSDVTGCAVTGGGLPMVVSASRDGTLKLWDARTGAQLRTLEGHGGPVTACAASAGGALVVSASGDRTLKLWDAQTGELLRTLEGHAGSIESCALSADGSLCVSASWDGTLMVWHVASGYNLGTLAGHSGPVHGCALGPGGDLVVSAGADGTLRLWDARTGAPGPVLVGHNPAVWACAVDPGGRFVVSGGRDGTVRTWDPATGDELATFRGHVGGVHACAVTPDGECVVSAGQDGTLRVWEAATGRELTTLVGHVGTVWDCAIAPDGTFVVSAGQDSTLRTWDVRREMPRTRGGDEPADLVAEELVRAQPGDIVVPPTRPRRVEEGLVRGFAALAMPGERYREARRETLRRAVQSGALRPSGSAPDSEQEVEPAEGRDLDVVDCTVFAPPAVRPGDELLVQVFAHTWEQTEAAVALAHEFDVDAGRRGVTTLEIEIAPGTWVTCHLEMPTLVVPEAVGTLVWRRRPTSVQFAVRVPDGHRLGAATGKVTVCVDDIPRGEVTFKLDVVSEEAHVDREPVPVGDDGRHYTLAFVSYAFEDLDAALHCVQVLRAAGIGYFQDILGIEPLERWESKLVDHIKDCDLFLLVWSKWAKGSEWVEREFDLAMGRKQDDDLAPPAIGLYVLEDGVAPWAKYSGMHFRDPVVYMRRGLAGAP